jgi:hypothetical protein
MAMHLGLAPQARNNSLTPGFLCGCSLGHFGEQVVRAWCSKDLQLCRRGRSCKSVRVTKTQLQTPRQRLQEPSKPASPSTLRMPSHRGTGRPCGGDTVLRLCNAPLAGSAPQTFAQGTSSAVDAYLRVRLPIVLPHAKYGPTLGLEASAVFRVPTQGLPAQSCQLSSPAWGPGDLGAHYQRAGHIEQHA